MNKKKDKEENKSVVDWLCSPETLLKLSLIIIIFALAAPLLFTIKSSGCFVFGQQASWVGETFGIMNPFIAIAAAIITFAAFYMQWLANEKVNKQEKHRQINELSTYHLTLVESIKLYEAEYNENTVIDATGILSETHHYKENVLRSGSESLYALYSKIYLFWILQDILNDLVGEGGFVEIPLFGKNVRISKGAVSKFANEWGASHRNTTYLEAELTQSISKEKIYYHSNASLKRLIEYYGYLFMHVFSHLFHVFGEIEADSFLDKEEKERKGASFAKMIPAFEVVIVFLMIESNVEPFIKENRIEEIFPVLKKYGFFKILEHVDFFMKNEFLEHKARYI